MARYFRVTIGTKLNSLFSIVYDTVTDIGNFNHTAFIYNREQNTYRSAVNVTYNELTQYNYAVVQTDNDVHKLKIVDENGYCDGCLSEELGSPIGSGNPASTANIFIYNYVSNSSGASFPTYYGMPTNYSWNAGQSVTDGTGTGKVHGVTNNSDETVYIRLKAEVSSGTHYPDAVAEIVYDGNNSGNSYLYIGTLGGTQNISPGSGTVTNTSPQYSGNTYWTLGPGKSIAFGIHPGYYTANSRVSDITYTLAFSTSASVLSTQTEISNYQS